MIPNGYFLAASQPKEERYDEAEINELAEKIRQANEARFATGLGYLYNPLVTGQPLVLAHPGQPTIQQFFGGGAQQQPQQQQVQTVQQTHPLDMSSGVLVTGATNGSAAVTKPEQPDKEKQALIDEESKKGRFGWFDIEKTYLPYIYRYGTEKYTSVRMVERRLLNRYLQVLPQEVNNCTCIRSYYLSDAESKLLNEINMKHQDCIYGKEAFTSKDLVVRLKDAQEFQKFLDLCHKKLVLKRSNASDRCGFFRINGESVVPYTVKEGTKYVPLFYFEGETDHLKLKSETVQGWDLAYLKFCCKVQGIRNELFANEICSVVALEEIKGHFPSGTTFEDYWPAKGSIEAIPNTRSVAGAGNWTQKPAGQPSAKMQSAVQMQPNGMQTLNQLSALNAAAAAAGYRMPQQLTAQQLQQLASQQAMTQQQLQQLMRSGLLGNPAAAAGQQQQPAAARQQPQQQRQSSAASNGNKPFPTKLTQIKEFPIERSNQPPYKLQKALIDNKIVPCINVRPFVFHDLMMTLPDFVKHFFPDLPLEKAREMLQEILKVTLYKGNSGHQDILRQEGKCQLYDPAPLVLVKDIMTYMPQIKYMFSNLGLSEPASKRQKVN